MPRTGRAGAGRNPENVLLLWMPVRRTDAQQLYDSMLKATGRLDSERFGPPAKLDATDSGEARAEGSPDGYWWSICIVLGSHTTPLP